MSTWARRLRGALGMGLLWALGWGFVGGLIELTWNIWPGFPLGPWMDMWIQGLAIPGFVGGVLFALILGITEHHRKYEELSTSRFVAWGGLAGVLLGGLVVLIGQPSHWMHGAVVAGVVTAMSATTAGLSLPLARMVERKALRGEAAPDQI